MKFFFRIISIHLIIFISFTGCSNDQEKKLNYLKKGDKYFQAEQYREAELEYKNAIQIDKKYTEAIIKLGDTFIKLNNPQKAFIIYSNAEKISQENKRLLINLAKLYLLEKDQKGANTRIEKVLEKEPDNIEALYLKAQILTVQRNFDKALLIYKKILDLDYSHVKAIHGLAYIKSLNKKYDQVEKLLIKATKISPDEIQPRHALISFYISQKNFEKALKYLQKFQKGETVDARSQYFKVLVFIGLGKKRQAISAAVKAVEQNPGHLKSKLLLANLYFHQQSFILAEKLASEILNIDPENYHATLVMANSLFALKKITKAEKKFKKLIEINPENASGYFRLAQLKYTKKKYGRAEKLLHKAYTLNNNSLDVFALRVRNSLMQLDYEKAHLLCDKQLRITNNSNRMTAIIYNHKATVYMNQMNPKEAKTALKKAIKIDPDYLRSYWSFAKIFLSQKELDSAIIQFKKILEKNHSLASSHMMLGIIYEAKKDFLMAETHYRNALDNDPDFAPAANNLAYLLAEHTEKYDEALQYAKKVKEQIPESAEVMDTMGLAFYKKELYGKAVEEFLDSLEKNPDNPMVHYHLGLAYNKNGNFELAKRELSLAIELKIPFEDKNNAKHLLEKLNKE